MNNFKFPQSRRLVFVMFAGLLLLFFASCIKDHNNYYNPPAGYLNVVQASPDQPPLNFFLNNNLANTRPFQLGDFTGYFRAYTGTRTANFDNAYSMGQVLSDTVQIRQNQYYSLFLVNTNAHPQYLFLTDTLNQPASGQAGIRFINLGPDAGAVDFSVQGTNFSVNNKVFLGRSGFVSVTAGNYTLQVKKAGTSTVIATLASAVLSPGGLYTVWLQGLSAGTSASDKLSVTVMQNVQF
jgi:hypothetical protein